MAKEFMKGRRGEEEAEFSGLWHDIGKYGDRFQDRLHGKDHGLDHWSQGASLALTHRAIAAALAIEGHHIGLQPGNKDSLRRLHPDNLSTAIRTGLSLSEPNISLLQSLAKKDGLDFTPPPHSKVIVTSWEEAVAKMLDIRMLFSCLVDADFLDTEAHFEGGEHGKIFRPAGPKLDSCTALAALDTHREALQRTTRALESVSFAREKLWHAVTRSAQKKPGTFTLTAPTGCGKTLAMLKFALEHAKCHGLTKIIVVVPFLTIIEQTAHIYRKIFKTFSENFVLEHHSLAGLGVEKDERDAEGANERQRRLLAENWDAPIILTSNVQLLESLFSNRPSNCRKLHNLMDSIILFDEAQSIPQHLAVPTLAALSHLSVAYRSTIVFSTATQPAFDTLNDAVKKYVNHGWQPREAVPDHPELFLKLNRVKVMWPQSKEKKSWEDVASEVRKTTQILCVVNLKRHALTLLEALDDLEGVFHLSTNLCPEHRREVLTQVRKRLSSKKTCRLISTQCVEAGVDIDFPIVYRAMAPLEAIAQAAGRCNREGHLNEQGCFGTVVVFEVKEENGWRKQFPTHSYYQATQVTQNLLNLKGNLDIMNPNVFRDYYQRLYNLNNPGSQNTTLIDAITGLDFPEVANSYRLITQNTIQILVPWTDRYEEFHKLRTEAEEKGISTNWIRRAQGLAVSIYRPVDGHPAWAIPAKLKHYHSENRGISDEWFILEGNFYDNILGLSPPTDQQVFIA